MALRGAELTGAEAFTRVEGRHKDNAAVGLLTYVSALPATGFGPNLLHVER